MTGWIKLHRVLLDKAIWKCSTPEQKTILITLLMMASHKENEWDWNGEKFIIKPGQFITSLKSIVEKAGSGITIQNVRTSIVKFEKYEFLTNESTNKNRLITIVNWDSYQSQETNLTSNLTSNQQTTNKQLTTIKNDKNVKEEIYGAVINYLNEKANKRYRATTNKTQSLIDSRIKEGFSIDDFKKVIDIKVSQWISNDEMDKYLRPETLFGNKFESYLNENISTKTESKQQGPTNWRGSDKRL